MFTIKSAAVLMLLSSQVSAKTCQNAKSYDYVDENSCAANNILPTPIMPNYSVDQCFESCKSNPSCTGFMLGNGNYRIPGFWKNRCWLLS